MNVLIFGRRSRFLLRKNKAHVKCKVGHSGSTQCRGAVCSAMVCRQANLAPWLGFLRGWRSPAAGARSSRAVFGFRFANLPPTSCPSGLATTTGLACCPEGPAARMHPSPACAGRPPAKIQLPTAARQGFAPDDSELLAQPRAIGSMLRVLGHFWRGYCSRTQPCNRQLCYAVAARAASGCVNHLTRSCNNSARLLPLSPAAAGPPHLFS